MLLSGVCRVLGSPWGGLTPSSSPALLSIALLTSALLSTAGQKVPK